MNNMERTTVMLPRDLKQKAAKAASEQHLSVGELIRTSLREKISRTTKISKEDAFFADTEVFEGDVPSDIASHHDDYLYGKKQ